MSKYINPYTDFGFKKLFGEEVNKELLIDFLNELLPEYHQIADLAFQNVEALPDGEEERKAFFDIHCTATNGERFIVEMQKAKVKHFKDRALFYTTFPIRDQAKIGRWNFYLDPIYFIAVLDFWYEDPQIAVFRRDVRLKDQSNEVFSDKLNFVFLQMKAFNKTEDQLETHFDKWAYFLKNLESFDSIPQILNEKIFERAFGIAEMAKLDPAQRDAYERSRLDYIAVQEIALNAAEEGREQGRLQGRLEGRLEGLQEGLQKGIEQKEIEAILGFYTIGITTENIARALGLSEERVQAIIDQHTT